MDLKIRNFLSARFARGEYLGLHLTIGLLISAGALWLFGGIAEDVITHERFSADATILGWMVANASATGDRIAVAASFVGSPVAMTVLALGVGAVLLRQKRWIVLWVWVAAFIGGGLLATTLKVAIRRPRPAGASVSLYASGWSFPSGHALGSFIGFGMLAYVLVTLWIHRRRFQVVVVVAAATLIVAVGLSRLYLGVHYFSDVVGAWAVGVVWLTACISGLEVARRRPARPSPLIATKPRR
jgi:membrane-associated phospholipid phosphatase